MWCGTKSNPSSKSYQTTEKWLAKCPQAPPYSNTPVIHFEFFYRRESGNYRFQIEHQKVGFLGRKIVWILSNFCLKHKDLQKFSTFNLFQYFEKLTSKFLSGSYQISKRNKTRNVGYHTPEHLQITADGFLVHRGEFTF